MELAKLCFSYVAPLAAVLGILSLLAFCYYCKFRRSFDHLPTFSIELLLFKVWATGKIPKDIPFALYFFNIIIEICKQFGKEGLCLIWGLRPWLFIFDEEYVKVFSNEHGALNKLFAYDFLAEMTGRGLLTSGGETWKKHRKMFNPSFRFEVLKGHVSTFNKGANAIVKKLEEVCDKPTVEVLDILKTGSLKILCESILGLKLDAGKYDGKTQRYLKLISRIPRPWLYWKYPQLLFQVGRKHWKLYREFQDFTKNIIMDLNESISSHAAENPNPTSEGIYHNGKSFTHILLESHMRDPSFTMEDLHAEINTFIFAGHDTTAHVILWCLFMFGLHPDVQEKAFEEAESVIGNNSAYSYGDLSRLIYLEGVIKETLRLYPIVPLYVRQTSTEIQCGKFKVPKNTVIVFAPYLMHRNPDIYPDPEKFDPERFLENSVKHPWAYTPFSEGIRSCIGKKFAMMEMKTILAHIIRNFKVTSLDKKEDVGINWNMLLTPLKPVRFHLTHRKSQILPQG